MRTITVTHRPVLRLRLLPRPDKWGALEEFFAVKRAACKPRAATSDHALAIRRTTKRASFAT